MALVGQIMTVSDVLTNGTVDEYILGADANIFQTKYDSNGVLTDWTIDHPNNYIKSNMYGFYYFFGHNTPRMRAKIGSSSMKLGGNAQTDDTDSEYPFIYMDYDLNKHITINGGNSSLRILKDSIDLNVGYSSINIKYESMSLGSNNNIISFEHNKRPYFGSNGSNYVVSNYDLQYGLGHHNHDYLRGNGSYSHLSLSFGDISLGHYISFKDVVNNHDFYPGYFSYSHSSIQGWNDVGSQGTSVHTTSTEGYLQYTDGSNNNMFYVSSAGAAVYGSAFRLNTSNILTSNNCSLISLHTNGIGIGIGARDAIQMTGPMYAHSLRYAPTEGAQNIMLNALNEVILTGGSSRRLKKDITDLIDKKFNPELLYELPLKQFKYKEDPQNRDIIGFIAEEVEEFYPGASIYHYDKLHNKIIDDWEVRYIVPPMLKLIQDQHQEIETLKAEIAEIKELLKNK